jgi:hypothetical protein
VKPTREEVETSVIQNKRKLKFEKNRGRRVTAIEE